MNKKCIFYKNSEQMLSVKIRFSSFISVYFSLFEKDHNFMEKYSPVDKSTMFCDWNIFITYQLNHSCITSNYIKYIYLRFLKYFAIIPYISIYFATIIVLVAISPWEGTFDSANAYTLLLRMVPFDCCQSNAYAEKIILWW